MESVADEVNRAFAPEETWDAASVHAWFSDLGHLFEQNGKRAEAAQASCATGDSLGSFIGIAEARDGVDENYRAIVRGCVADGIHDCTALAPTPKAECEALDPEYGYLLDSSMLENGMLEDWPYTAASSCTLIGAAEPDAHEPAPAQQSSTPTPEEEALARCYAAAYFEQWDDSEVWDAYLASPGFYSLDNLMVDMWIGYRCGYPSDYDPVNVCRGNGLIDLVGLEVAATVVWGAIEGRALGAVDLANLTQVLAACDPNFPQEP